MSHSPGAGAGGCSAAGSEAWCACHSHAGVPEFIDANSMPSVDAESLPWIQNSAASDAGSRTAEAGEEHHVCPQSHGAFQAMQQLPQAATQSTIGSGLHLSPTSLGPQGRQAEPGASAQSMLLAGENRQKAAHP